MKINLQTEFPYLSSVLHDQPVERLVLEDERLLLVVNCFNDEKQIYEPVTIRFDEIGNLKINGAAANFAEKAYSEVDGGEILSFEIRDKVADMLVQWGKIGEARTDLYRFTFGHVGVHDQRTGRLDLH